MFRLALVTGASAGIGASVSLLLARKGVTVILVARASQSLTLIRRQIEEEGGRCMVMECDLTNREEIIRMATRVKEELGVPDLIVNNAGAYYFQRLEDKDYDSWDRMIDLNILGYLLIIAEFLADMKARDSGTIVNITSDNQREADPGLTVYVGTKFFWAGASQSLRKELQGCSVRVVNVLPGWVDTEGLRKALQDEKQASVMAELGLGEVENLRDSRNHMLRPEDVAETVWDVINKPSNVYINDIMIKDRLQSL